MKINVLCKTKQNKKAPYEAFLNPPFLLLLFMHSVFHQSDNWLRFRLSNINISQKNKKNLNVEIIVITTARN